MWTILLSFAITTGAPPAVQVHTLNGETVTGVLTELSATELTLDSDKGAVKLPLEKLTGLTVKEPQTGSHGQPTVWLEMVDGSSILGTAYTAVEGRARLTLTSGDLLEIPTQDIRWVRFQTQSEPVAQQWSKILDADAKTDLLVIKKGDAIDYHKGVIKDVTEDTVQFVLDGETLPVKRAKVHGLAYHHPAGRELPGPLCFVNETTGMAWAVRSVETMGGNLQWTTTTGLKVIRPVSTLAKIDFSRGKVLYLSDLKPDSSQWVPYFGTPLPAQTEFYSPKPDRSLMSGPLQVDGKNYAKGLAVHSKTTLVYRLPERYSRFAAIAAIDDRVRPNGHVQLVIRGDERVLLDTTVAGTDPPKPIDVDVKDVRRLTILVDFGEDLDIADHLDLCEARFVK